MAAWNTDSGVAMHAEPIAKKMIEMGHEITVFSFMKNDFHGEAITAEDENFVKRCFGTRQITNYFDARPFINEDYEILLVEDIGMLPVDKLSNIIPIIKRKAKIIHVIHENRPCEHSWFYKIDWDGIVYFDKRQEFFHRTYPDAVYIPFPCYDRRRKNIKEIREKLDLPIDKNIVYSFAHRRYHLYYRSLPDYLKNNTVLLQVIPEDYHQMLEELNPPEWMIFRRQKEVTTEEFDNYLFAADAAVFHKFQAKNQAVLSSTMYQALGAGCPLFGPKGSDFFEGFKNEVVKYIDTVDLNEQLNEILNNENKRNELISNADKFVEKYSPEKIANQYLELFKKLLKQKRSSYT